MHNVGDTYLADFAKPQGLCDEAWKAMYQYVFALSHGSDIFYYGDWIDKPGLLFVAVMMVYDPLFLKLRQRMKYQNQVHNIY